MNEMDTSALEALAARQPAKRSTTKEWSQLTPERLHAGSYLAADPSLDAFGLVLLEVTPHHTVSVHLAETFKAEVPGNGWQQVLDRGERLEILLTAWMDQWVRPTDWGDVKIVHESPPIGGGKFLKPELGLMASNAFRRAARGYPRLPMVRPSDHQWLQCGRRSSKGNKLTKADYHGPLKQLYDWIRGSDLVTNEAKRDALSVALYAAHRGI